MLVFFLQIFLSSNGCVFIFFKIYLCIFFLCFGIVVNIFLFWIYFSFFLFLYFIIFVIMYIFLYFYLTLYYIMIRRFTEEVVNFINFEIGK